MITLSVGVLWRHSFFTFSLWGQKCPNYTFWNTWLANLFNHGLISLFYQKLKSVISFGKEVC